MKIHKYIPPYQKNGKTSFPSAVNKSGVYLIKENGNLVYVGSSSYNLYKTLYRHFQEWNHKYQKVISYKNDLKKHKYTVRVIYCTPKQAMSLQKALIIKHNPRDNDVKYENYLFDSYDKNTIQNYQNTDISDELPF